MKFYIISLPNRGERRNKIINRLESLKLDYTIIDAVTPDSELVKEYRETWDKASSMIELLKAFGCDVSNQLDGPLYVGH